ncbi:CRISPR/Cas system CSM-associated protein Csm3, group 7 of RAMP superfamily [Actinopolyspora mzabensis]|uniref:CRISPR/Cas system CSM-associated protein Csm3, group 7 of RAMP superfamily n=1 Tax=Actinopolyspora mzabensis TaxID=995066 RepID=A0A1G9D0B8_ACTMZ|nr:RAMP superfamily CRISPR-associated protein [Actinopolyspora mzabensis]SDK57362.1 CRISPR/Cas system CSM-associated protein Csm3, group 7 of RAMP superfamily [Actinopolyspora mzabensis]
MKSALFSLRLRMLTPGGVTAPEALDAPQNTVELRRDHNNNVHLPGSTVAGSLREHCSHYTELHQTGDLPELFGPAPEPNERRAASPVGVLGTLLRVEKETSTAKRTSIDRKRGAAANTELHHTELLAAGTEFDVVLRWEHPDERLDTFLRALREWRPSIGRGASHGAGKCQVVGLGHRVYDLDNSKDLLDWIGLTSPEDYPTAEPCTSEAPDDRLIDVELRIEDGLHIGAGEPETDSESGKLISQALRRDEDEFLVPGTSLKGVLRSRVEYICRVVGAAACTGGDCGRCRPCRIFGFSGKEAHTRRARIAVHDSTVTDHVAERRQHVAIDRFTGGARPKLLYTDEVVTAGRFRLRIDELEPLDEPEPAGVSNSAATPENRTGTNRLLLEAALTDIHDGLVGIGGRTTAGCGTVSVSDPDWQRPAGMTELAERLREEHV